MKERIIGEITINKDILFFKIIRERRCTPYFYRGKRMHEKIANVTGLTHEEWLRLRKTAVGESDAGAVCGVNPFVSAISVYQDK